MFIPLRRFGSIGAIYDTLPQYLPMGAWSDARNVRFTGAELEKMLEPASFGDYAGATPKFARWFQPWSDGFSSYMAAVFADAVGSEYLFFWVKRTAEAAGVWEQRGGPYTSGGDWQSFEWGNSCIFNNGLDAPQIWDEQQKIFVDLPNWGLISFASDIANDGPPTRDTGARCTVLRPLRGFLVACGVTEGGRYSPNTVWWSDAVTASGVAGAPSWDYESPATLSGQSEVGLGDGKIRTAEQLNENLIIYTDGSATAMQVAGGSVVMQFRRLFNKGAAALNAVAEFNNQHFAVARDQIYIHDGSTVKEIAKDRIEEEFFRRAGKGGRFGQGSVDWNAMQVVKNPDRKEIYVLFEDAVGVNALNNRTGDGITGGGTTDGTPGGSGVQPIFNCATLEESVAAAGSGTWFYHTADGTAFADASWTFPFGAYGADADPVFVRRIEEATVLVTPPPPNPGITGPIAEGDKFAVSPDEQPYDACNEFEWALRITGPTLGGFHYFHEQIDPVLVPNKTDFAFGGVVKRQPGLEGLRGQLTNHRETIQFDRPGSSPGLTAGVVVIHGAAIVDSGGSWQTVVNSRIAGGAEQDTVIATDDDGSWKALHLDGRVTTVIVDEGPNGPLVNVPYNARILLARWTYSINGVAGQLDEVLSFFNLDFYGAGANFSNIQFIGGEEFRYYLMNADMDVAALFGGPKGSFSYDDVVAWLQANRRVLM